MCIEHEACGLMHSAVLSHVVSLITLACGGRNG
jgi:hypothetical protein